MEHDLSNCTQNVRLEWSGCYLHSFHSMGLSDHSNSSANGRTISIPSYSSTPLVCNHAINAFPFIHSSILAIFSVEQMLKLIFFLFLVLETLFLHLSFKAY